MLELVQHQLDETVLRINPAGRISFATSDGQSGWHGLGFISFLDGCLRYPEVMDIEEEGGGKYLLRCRYPGKITETIFVEHLDSPERLRVRREFHNHGTEPVSLNEVRTERFGSETWVRLMGLSRSRARMVCPGNLRESHRRVWDCRYPCVTPLPDTIRRIGDSEDEPLPAWAVASDDYCSFLVEGALQQEYTAQNWEISSPRFGKTREDIDLFEDYAAVTLDPRRRPLRIPPDSQVVIAHMYYQILFDADPVTVFDDYIADLCRLNEMRAADSPLRRNALYHAGGLDMGNEEESVIYTGMLERRCKLLAEKFPAVKYVVVGGNSSGADRMLCSGIGSFYSGEGEGAAGKQLASGWKHLAEVIRDAGLMPLLQLSASLRPDIPLVKERPEWLCRDEEGEPWSMMNAGSGMKAALDFSVPQVRDFFRDAAAEIIVDWDYSGIVLESFLHAFQSRDIRFRNGHAVEWRNRILETISGMLPEDGVLLISDPFFGNPLLGRYVDSCMIFPSGSNGASSRSEILAAQSHPALWLAGTGTLLPYPGPVRVESPVEEFERELDFRYILQGALGLAGDIESVSEDSLGRLEKVFKNIERGGKLHCPDSRFFTGAGGPDALFAVRGRDGEKTGILDIGFFNWQKQAAVVGYPIEVFGLKPGAKVRDFYTGKRVKLSGNALVAQLPAGGSRLFTAET